MREFEPYRVQRLTLERRERREHGRTRRCRRAFAPAVNRIADDRVSRVRQMHADLMRASGLELHARERMRTKSTFDPIVGDGLATIGAHRHPRALRAMSTDWLGDGAATGHEAVTQREVFAPDLACGERSHQRCVRNGRARDHQQS